MSTPVGTLSVQVTQLLLSCLCSAVQEQPNPPIHCSLRAGIEAVADADLFTDLCCEGLAYVIPQDTWPTYIFPQQDITRQANANCGIVSWALEYRLGVMRCAPAGTDNTMPTDAEWTALAIQMLYDAESLRRTICCFEANLVNLFPAMDGLSVVAGRQQQGPISGGCVERFTTLQIQLPSSCCPPLPSP